MICTTLTIAAQLALVALPVLGPGGDAEAQGAGPRFEAESLFASERPGTTRVVVDLGAPAATNTRVHFLIGGSATQGEDYLITASPLVVPAGQSTATILVDILGDFEDEGNETLELTLVPDGTVQPGRQVSGGPTSSRPKRSDDTIVINIWDPQLGDPINGLTPNQLAAFNRGKVQFARRWNPSEGLGPFYNATSCASCHSTPVMGGGSDLYRNFYLAVYQFGPTPLGQSGSIPPFLSQVVPAFGSGAEHEFTTDFTLEGGRALLPDTVFGFPVLATQRNAIPVFGVGLFEGVTDATILGLADISDSNGDGISGAPNTQLSGAVIGRLGMKSQSNNIELFTRGPLQNQMGITSDPFDGPDGLIHLARQVAADPNEPTVDADPAPDPEISRQELGDLIAFGKFVAPPVPSKKGPDALAGESLFDSIGCTKCHVASLPSSFGDLHAYTDLLIHDMGNDLADNIKLGDNSNNWREFRTQPLWGIKHFPPYLHDGRAHTLEDAILWHGGEALAIRNAYDSLTGVEKAQIISFLESL